LRNVIFEFHHSVTDIVGNGLDVVRRCGAHVCVSEDSLNHHIRHTEAVQGASQSAPRRVPAVPLRQSGVTLEFVVSALVFSFSFPA
jgi:hypothetical protein